MKTTIAAIQLNSQPKLNQNLDQIYHFIKEAAEEGAKLVGLPENFAFYGDDEAMVSQASEISGQVEEKLPEWAQEFGVYILAGGYPVPAENGKVYNHAIMVNPEGETIASYNKMHLFDVSLSEDEKYGESDYTQAGKPEPVVVGTPDLPKMGLSICYDVRFPELYRKQAEAGAELLTVPSAFTQTTGSDHWEVLLRARAIENTAYLIAPAQTGTHGEYRKTFGHAMIIDPWGKVLADAGIMPGVITAEVDLDYLEDVRKKLPSLRHRVL
ncbi:carbon-nitrogen hydrolase family protein [Gracilimonas mengyeensis]|uniref:Predicted amidohydrolase n=1 Tax=Gracilimonas mengyeensis TaxID=1302730 RepID=A0A521D5K4_9BACT|nr:carbon-nitrogen hydrolase family protein [Gracilimonas mengyeensis]SMO66968.1 Predicted amidohydrolase [Gracilimonas mengyeensis]